MFDEIDEKEGEMFICVLFSKTPQVKKNFRRLHKWTFTHFI